MNGNTALALTEMGKVFAQKGLQTMRTLARNMAFLMKSVALGKAQYGMPAKEEHQFTNFIR